MRKINKHQVAWWSAVASFFATIGAIGAINILDPNDRLRFVSAVFVGIVTGGATYTRERLHEVKDGSSEIGGDIVVSEDQGKKTFSLELLGRLEKLQRIRQEERPDNFSSDGLLMAATNLIGIFAILQHENLNVITSKALSFVTRTR